MDTNTKTLFEFDAQGNLVFVAESLDLPVIYQTNPSAALTSPEISVLSPQLQVGQVRPDIAPALDTVRTKVVRIAKDLISLLTMAVATTAALVSRIRLPRLSVTGAVEYVKTAGTLRLLGNGLILAGVLGLIVSFYPIVSSQMGFLAKNNWFTAQGDDPTVLGSNSGFGAINEEKPKIYLPALTKEPINKDFGILIDKIDVNAPVVADVNSADYNDYINALKKGAAHAKGTAYPGQGVDGNNNVFIFAHSTLNLWDVPRYNAIFILLNKLEPGDRITTFYKGLRYDYIVDSKKIVEADDVKYLTEPSSEHILTLQTCDPPGTNLRRLIVTAKLVNEEGQ